jgi:hypothetical protein
MDLSFDTWNVRSLYRAGSLMTVASEISKYKSDLVGHRRSDGTGVVLRQQANIHFYIARKMKTLN